MDVDLILVIGTGMSNQSWASAAHGPIVQTNALHSTPPINDDGINRALGPPSLCWPVQPFDGANAQLRPPATAASISFVQSSLGAT